jgi:hypothetical protein
MVMVRVTAGLVEVTIPKSSSLGVQAMGLGVAVVAGMVAVWVVALSAWAVRVPGFVLVLVSAMAHSAPGARVVVQLWARVKLVAVSWRLVAARVPRLRRVMLGESSVERARLGAAVAGLSLAR